VEKINTVIIPLTLSDFFRRINGELFIHRNAWVEIKPKMNACQTVELAPYFYSAVMPQCPSVCPSVR